jgi:hypothetical protein
MIGIAAGRVSTLLATRATVMDVVVDELCTRLVVSIPINNPTIGFDVVVNNCSANPFPKNLNDPLIKDMLTKNRYNNPIRSNNLIRGLFFKFMQFPSVAMILGT